MCLSNYVKPEKEKWKLWECDAGRRWSSKYSTAFNDGDICFTPGHRHEHFIHLIAEVESIPEGWYLDK